MTKTPNTRKITELNYWAWGSGDLVGAGITAVTAGWLIYFYTTFCNMSAVEAASIFAISRLFDAITCPLIGYVSDHLRHTWVGRHIGRRKVFLFIAIPLLPSFALMWQTGHDFYYYLFAYLFFELIYNFVLIPWETLPAEMSDDYKVKAKFAGARILFAQGSAILASGLPTLIINYFGGKDSPDTFLINGAIFGVLASLVIIISVIFSWERPYSEAEKLIKPKGLNFGEILMIPYKMFSDLFSTFRIKAFRQHLSIYLGGYISQDIFNGAFALFVASVMLGSTRIVSQLMVIMYCFQLVSVWIAIRIIIKAGATRAYSLAIIAFILGCLFQLAFFIVRPADVSNALSGIEENLIGHIFQGHLSPLVVFWLIVPVALAGLGRGTLNLVPWSVYNYLPDIDEAVTGKRREGIFAGVMTLVRKLAQAGAIWVTGYIITYGGYVSGAKTQSLEAMTTVTYVMVFGPIIVMLLGLILAWNFRLNADTHAILLSALERLRAGEKLPDNPETKKVVEDLTGWRYEDLWGQKNGPK